MPKKKSSRKLAHALGKPDEKMLNTVLTQKLSQFNARYESITRIILSHTDRSFIDVRLALMEDRCQDLYATKDEEVKRYIRDVMKHPEILMDEVVT